MADITTTIKEVRTPKVFQDPSEVRTYQWDPANDGTGGTGTHNIIPIPEGYALLSADVVITEAFTSAGSATVKFLTGENDFTGAVPKAALTVGEVFPLLSVLDATATAGVGHYVDGTVVTAETLDVTVGTAALTAGKAIIVARLMNISNLQVRY